MDQCSPASRGRLRPSCAIAALAAALLAPLALARAADGESAPATAPDPAAPAPATPVFELPPVEVRRAAAERTQDPTGAVTVVPADRFAGETKQVGELVATAPGVAVNQYGGLGQLTTVTIRGSTGDGVVVLLDGIPLNTAFGGGVDLSTVPRQWIERLEVIRGAEGAHYGAGAMGGVVNVVTRAGQPGRWSAEAAGGSFGTAMLSGEGAAGGERWTLFTGVAGERSDGRYPYLHDPTPSTPGGWVPKVRDNNGAARAAGTAKLSAELGEVRLDALAQLSGGRRELAGWPERETPHDWMEDARAVLGLRLRGPGPGDALSWSARTSLRADDLAMRVSAAGDATLVRQRGGEAALQGGVAYAHPRGTLTFSGEASGEAIRADGLDSHTRARLAATAAEDLRLGRLRLSPAVRLERVGGFGGTSAKLGAVLELVGPLTLRASAGRTYRAPSFAELYLRQGIIEPNPELRPETAVTADASLVADGALGHAAAGPYVTRYRDLVFYQPSSYRQLKPYNAGKALMYGVEVEGASAPVRRLLDLTASCSYTWLHSENLRGQPQEVGRDVVRRPRHRLFARVGVAPAPLEAHLELHWVSRQYADAPNLDEIPAALIWNAGAAVRLLRDPALRLGIEVRNLADDRKLQDPLENPLPGRTVLVTLRGGSPTKGTP